VWQKKVAERQPFSASPAAEKGSEIANRSSLKANLGFIIIRFYY
jgi:hypothetical protein